MKRTDDLIAHLEVQSAELLTPLFLVLQLLVRSDVNQIQDLALFVIEYQIHSFDNDGLRSFALFLDI